MAIEPEYPQPRTPSDYLSRHAQTRLYTMAPNKGKYLDSETLLSCWDPVDECKGEACPVYERCPYGSHRTTNKKKGLCVVQRDYMRGVHTLMLRNFEDRMTEGMIFRIGQHLFPLYRTLIRINIEELAVESIVHTDDKGLKRANPIYREMRETIKQIEYIWKTLGFSEPAPIPRKTGNELTGNPDYYGDLEKDADRRRKILVKRKVK